MLYRKDAILMVVAAVLATSSLAMADAAPKTSLTLDPTVITADAAPSEGLLMMGLGKAGAAQTMKDLKLNIYGWVESGYTYNHRHNSYSSYYEVETGPFTHEYGNHYMLNQVALRFERQVDPKKFDVGGMVELMYGSDAAQIHATGLGYNGSDATDDHEPVDTSATFDNFWPTWQFDIPQAYVDVGVPIGNGLRVRAGKFVTLLGYESIDPRGNPFYSHSNLFGFVPFTHVGVMGDYKVNDNLEVQLGITRGWDIGTEDTNGCAIDVLGQIAYKFNDSLNLAFNFCVGPENGSKTGNPNVSVDFSDTSHYRVALDPILYWQVTKQLKVGVEGLYVFDGGWSNYTGVITHAYGDVWGAAGYAAYTVNDNLTINARLEKAHVYNNTLDLPLPVSMYEVTLGVTIVPLPKDQFLKGLSIRPEIRYDFTDNTTGVYPTYSRKTSLLQKDQLTFAADVIFQF